MKKTGLTLSEIIVALSKLTTDELQIVMQQARLLAGSEESVPTGSSSSPDSDMILFYQQACNVLKQNGLSTLTWFRFQKNRYFKQFEHSFQGTRRYSRKHFGKLNRRDRVRLYKIYAELIYNWMNSSKKVNVSSVLFFRSLNLIPVLMTNAFPGYAVQGWLPLVLKMGSRNQIVEQE